MQTSVNFTESTLSPTVLSSSLTSPSSLGLQGTMNGSIPELTVNCNSHITDLLDSPSKNLSAPLQDNMENPKEKTPMCLVNELARFNRVQPQYKLLNERGPAHAKMFSVQLTLGEQTWQSEGSSIKKAQHAAANKALRETTLPKPTPRPPKNNINSNPGSITPTVELNGLAMKRGEPAIYRPLDPKPFPNYRANYNFRGMYNQRYHCPVPKVFYVQLTVGNNEFFGEGKTRQAARHNAATKALQALQNEPIPEKLPQNGESGKEIEEEKDANKSEISLVFEIGLKRNMPVTFEVIKESGPPHMKSFVTRVSVGEFSAEGEGNSKKLSKKRAASSVLQELRKLPPLPVIEKPKLYFRKRPKTILKADPEYGQGMNPVSCLAQIQQARKEKEPDYALLSDRGKSRRREFLMQVKVGTAVATGIGLSKKIAKRNAAEAMLLHLGYKTSTPVQEHLEKFSLWMWMAFSIPNLLELSWITALLRRTKFVIIDHHLIFLLSCIIFSWICSLHSTSVHTVENKGWNSQKIGFPETTSNTPKGILHLSPDIYQEMEASRNKVVSDFAGNYLSSSEMSQPSSSFFSLSPPSNSTTTLAREFLMNGTSPSAEAIGLKGTSTSPCPIMQPSRQMEYLARIQGFQAALNALKQFSEQGLDPLEGAIKTENGSFEQQAKHLGEKADNKQTNSGTMAHDCKDSKAVV
ncbi:double-stranded RNA-binding protein Staufen homolog 2 isoform X2 [Sminthopsis crassicaudata]|uniref:double-stranded RNA-binding protein Staufen homolog 2 isoform X2 n=1 Tax=Sminthopsis crassicaudata TaxID=9301 RepID=UPI003D68A4CF